MVHDGRRFIINGGLVTALLGAFTGSLWVWFLATGWLGEPDATGDRHATYVGFACGAVLLLVGLAPITALRSPRWLQYLAVLLSAAAGLAATVARREAAMGPREALFDSNLEVVASFLRFPMTWPLIALVIATPVLAHRQRVRGSSSRSRRSRPAR